MARRSGLGRGLGALIPGDLAHKQGTSGFQEVPIGAVRPNPYQPRTAFDEESLASLAASIAEVGVLQPILVRPVPDEDGQPAFELIAGERRLRAAKRAGLQAVPALVREADDLASLEHAVVENLHRKDLNPLEEAAAYKQLLEDFSLTHEQLATRVGKSRASVSNLLRLLQLPASVQKLVRDGEISEGHAKALLGTPDRAYQEALGRRIVSEGLSVRATEEAVRARSGRSVPTPQPGDADPAAEDPTSPRPPRPRPAKEPGLLELENLLGDLLSTRVSVDMGAGRGKVVIEFADLDDLERIYRVISGA